MEVVQLTPDLEATWEQFVEASPGATFAHLLGWRNVVTRTYHHIPYYLLARDAGQVVGVLPLFLIRSRLFGRFLVTGPYLSHGGLLAGSESAAGALLQAGKEIALRERARYMEIRGWQRLGHGLVLKDKYCTFLITLVSDPHCLWERFEGRGRKAVRRALRAGLTVDIGHDLVDRFDAALSQHMRELGTPFHRANFYRHLLEELSNQSEILMVRRGGQYLGGLLLVSCKDTVVALYGGALTSERHMSPMSLLLWETIRYSFEKGFRYIDLGRSQWDSGTSLFKRQWGAEPVPIFYEYYLAKGIKMPDVYPSNPRFRLAIAIWKRFPLWLTKSLGPWIIRDIP
jgi:FemAB-related protein (PEP-CTERM system-associated)